MNKKHKQDLPNENEEKFVKNVRINQKERVKTLLIFLIAFNALLLMSLTYLCLSIKTLLVCIVSGVIFALIVVYSIVTFVRGMKDVEVKLYTDILVINSFKGKTVVEFKDVYSVKVQRTLLQKILRKPANSLMLTVRNDTVKRVLILFVESNLQKLIDKINLFAIRERLRKNSPEIEK